ncbi:P-loop NTPase fold protein [Yokenella regensburgei]|uniref:P-loop NTPase fold protein n=1 Tax=Yokenella regensburgei TaxID=158877 RepID=UPI0013754FF9|nr:P-loop NTPase fold protein [Yokenella regensburgei]KAF1366304.1 hypothetical protein FHR25_005230 [Yokenella regensburgei]
MHRKYRASWYRWQSLAMRGLGIVSTGMKTLSKLDLLAHKETTELLMRQIEAGIARSGLNFIVLIDDLDRPEPAQALVALRLSGLSVAFQMRKILN